MKQISSSTYRNLPPNARIVAYLEAVARGDELEARRLVSSCPKVACRQTDPRFANKMAGMMKLAMAVQADLKESALCFFVSLRIDPHNSTAHLQDFADIRQAWAKTLKALGVSNESMARAGPPTSPVFSLLEDLLPEPEFEKSQALSEEMLKLLSG